MHRIQVLSIAALASLSMFAASPCASLSGLVIPNVTIASAADVAAGPFNPGGETEAGGRARPMNVPAFCRVMAIGHPVNDSEIHFEVWMPAAAAWNGKFEGTGNGGFSSAMGYAAMATALNKGYAAAGSDTGHTGGDLKFAVGHSEKINDWAYRAVHVMTENAKVVVRDYYGKLPQFSYFNGCSTGGHQALTEAQRFPNDYDGIVAGDPANNRIHLIAGFLWSWEALYKDPASPLPKEKLPMISKAAVEACDAMDGIKDGIIGDPRRCKFDPKVLLCKGADSDNCLTAPQVDAVKKIYAGPKNPRTGEQIFTGWPVGSESTWTGYIVGHADASRNDFWRYWVFNDPNWDWKTFDFDRDLAYADQKMAVVNSNEADLKAFKSRKGKLVMYHGWADSTVPPQDGVRYYESVEKAMGGAEKTTDFFRLFMVPGMGHCSGGVGPNQFDAVGALDTWVDQGKAPEKMIATHSTSGKVDRSRPLCPYPQIAKWKGSGSTDEAANFACAFESKPAPGGAAKGRAK